jgi:hypothetical protein
LEILAGDYYLNKAATRFVDCVADRSNQGWTLTAMEEILSTNGRCLSVADPTESSASMIVEDCNQSVKQKWTVNTLDKTISNQGFPNLCMDVNSEIATGVFYGKLSGCNGQASQQWYAHVLDLKRIESVSDPDFFINIESETGGPENIKINRADARWHSGYWTFEPAGAGVRIRNYFRPDRFVNIEYGELVAGNIYHYWESARWMIIKQVDGGEEYYLIKNFWKQDIYLGISGDMTLIAGRLDEINPGSQRWKITAEKPPL